MNLFVFFKPEFDTGKNQEYSKNINDPMELFEQGYAEKNEDQPENECAENSPEQNPVLVDGIDAEVGENKQEDKNVVDTEGFLDQVACKIVQGGLRTDEVVNSNPENDGLCYPDTGPDEALFDADFVGLSIEDFQVNNQHGQDEYVK